MAILKKHLDALLGKRHVEHYNMNVLSLNTSQVTNDSSLMEVLLHLQMTPHVAATYIRKNWKHYRLKIKLTIVTRSTLTRGPS